MNRTCSRAPVQVSFAPLQAKEILHWLEGAVIVLTDRLFAALDRDRERMALGRLDDRALRDLGLSPGDRERI